MGDIVAFNGRGGGGGARKPQPPDNDEMEARVAKLEQFSQEVRDRLTKLETRSEQFATKADVSDAKVSIISWVVSAILLAQLLPAILKRFGM